jgi:hypothetical protein
MPRDVVSSLIGRITRSFRSFLNSPLTEKTRLGVISRVAASRFVTQIVV